MAQPKDYTGGSSHSVTAKVETEYANRTFEERICLFRYMYEEGLGETKAMNKLWPLKNQFGNRQNTNRANKVRRWQIKDLWPPTNKEMEQARAEGVLRSSDDGESIRKAVDRMRETQRILASGKVGYSSENLKERKYPYFPRKIRSVPLAFQAPEETVKRLDAIGGNKSEYLRIALEIFLRVLEDLDDGDQWNALKVPA